MARRSPRKKITSAETVSDNEEDVVVDSDGQYVTSNPCLSDKLWFLFYVPFNRPNEEVDQSYDQEKSIPENTQGGKRKKFVPFVGKNRWTTQVVHSEDDDMWVASIFFTLSLFLVSPLPQCGNLSTSYHQKEVSSFWGKEALDDSGCWIWGRGRTVCCIHFSFLIAFLRVSASTVLISLRLLLLQSLL